MDESGFHPIDRVVEFCLTLGVATQMTNSMNASPQAMQIPGARNAMQPNVLAEDQPLFYTGGFRLVGKAVGITQQQIFFHVFCFHCPFRVFLSSFPYILKTRQKGTVTKREEEFFCFQAKKRTFISKKA